MKLIRTLRVSTRQLGAHRTRTTPALLGIVIGVSSVITVVAVGHGARQEVTARIESMGTNLITITPAQTRTSAARSRMRGTVTTLTPQDAEAIQLEVPTVIAASPWASSRLPVRADGRATTTTILDIADADAVLELETAEGSLHSAHEELTAARTAVLGPAVARALFDHDYATGRRILIGQVPFQVIVVLAPRGSDLSGADQDDVVTIPLSTALRRVFSQEWLGGVYLRAASRAAMPEAEEQVRWPLRERHRLDRTGAPDDFEIQTQVELLAAHQEIGDTFTTRVAGIGAVSLIVGGIGILAIMLMSVRERTSEIGLRLAVGARRRDIRTQFLAEATMLGASGGLAGIALAVGGTHLLAAVTDWAVRIEPRSVVLACSAAFLIGVFFGAYPAARAARLEPADALHSE